MKYGSILFVSLSKIIFFWRISASKIFQYFKFEEDCKFFKKIENDHNQPQLSISGTCILLNYFGINLIDDLHYIFLNSICHFSD